MILTEEFRVIGMSCAACAQSVQSMLESLEGVDKAEVNFAAGSVTVKYNPELTGFDKMNHQLQSIGYGLEADWEKALLKSEEEEKRTARNARNKAILSIILAFPVFVIGMFLPPFPFYGEIQFILTLAILVFSGRNFFVKAWKLALHKQANMDTLIALGTGAAFIFSSVNLFFPDWIASHGLTVHYYFEAAAVVIALVLLGRYFEERSKAKTSQVLKSLLSLGVKEAWVIKEGKEVKIPVEKIKRDDIVKVLPGEKIPVDGKIIQGHAEIDESMLTGEAIPVFKESGHLVTGGTVNLNGVLHVQAQKVGSETVLSQIIRTIREAQSQKAPVQKLADKIAGVFVPVVIIISVITFIVWWLAGPSPSLTYAFITAITVLVIACPCALGLATPTALMVGVGAGARKGILIKNPSILEKTRKINVMVFDKTGTLTRGEALVSQIITFHEVKSLNILMKSLASQSSHILSQAIATYFKNEENTFVVENIQNLPGQGIAGMIDNKEYYLGNESLLSSHLIEIPEEVSKSAHQARLQGKSVVYFADNDKILTLILLSDPIKEEASEVIKKLHERGIEAYLLTGDHEYSARAIAEKCGIKNIKAGLKPDEKAAYLKELKEKGYHVAMVGDGINDGPAMALADIAIAMGSGNDIAIETADMVILKSNISKVLTALDLSEKTYQIIKQNLFWALFYNTVSIPIAAGVLYPVFHFLLNPMIAGAAMAFSSVSVVSNSLRLYKF